MTIRVINYWRKIEIMDKNANEIYERIQKTLMLENARPLYDGITNLLNQLLSKYSDTKTAEALQNLNMRNSAESFSKINNLVTQLILSAYDDDNVLIQQNPNFGFLTFWEKRFSFSPHKNIKTITSMLVFYNLIINIIDIGSTPSKRQNYDDLPYLYENLCGYIQKIMNCKNSYIIRHIPCGDAHIIARSAFLAKEIKNATELKNSDITKLIANSKINKEIPFNSVFENTVSDDFGFHNYQFRFVPLYETDGEQFFILLQYENKCPQTKEIIKILFARDNLKYAVLRDYEHLLNLRYELSFVRFFKNDENAKYPTIVHTSDLHADKLNPTDKNFSNLLDALKKEKDIDLFVLSGDIVDAKNSNASQTQENYDFAAKIIRKIVSTIWNRGDGRVSFDWKRRLLFVPGNHDFAAMNLVKAVFKQRSLAAGLPFDGNNKIVAKFAYYLNFIQDLIDAPIDQLICNEINEVREYKRMNTKIMSLNSSCGSSSARTNKVKVNESIVKKLAENQMWGNCSHSEDPYRVCIIHHPPFNSLDYTLDGYDVVPEWVWGDRPSPDTSINALYDSMKKAIKATYYIDEKGHYSTHVWEDFINKFDEECKDGKKYYKDIVKEYNNKGDNENKYYFTKDAATLYNYFKGDLQNKEYAEKLISDIKFNIQTAKYDELIFEECINTYLSGADLILSGHIHSKNKMEMTITADTSISNKVSIVGKLLLTDEEYDKKSTNYIRIIRVNGEKEITISDKEI